MDINKLHRCVNIKCGWVGFNSQMRKATPKPPRSDVFNLSCPKCDGNLFVDVKVSFAMTRTEKRVRRAATRTLTRLERETCICFATLHPDAISVEEWNEARGIIGDEMAKLHARLLRDIFDDIERRAESNMMKTGKLEGMHYGKDFKWEEGKGWR